MPLANTEDVAARLGRPVLLDEHPRIAAFLEDVCGLIEDYCGRDMDRRLGQSITLYPANSCVLPIPLRYRTFLTVAGARQDGREVTGWTFNGRQLTHKDGWGESAVVLTASWGYEVVPASVRAVACSEVIRWLALAPGIGRERVGEVEVEFSAPSSAQTLSQASRTSLTPYRRSRIGSLTLRRQGTALTLRRPVDSHD
ncbi:phage gp6-like head-tail connector protein [Streptomyces sp. NPDC051662]|uniref:phage gp6-like head-tail connector protein n=1 Tax=Streptomyces sp. NPDC051662 TaxID=3154750 RepID=UPI0034216D76